MNCAACGRETATRRASAASVPPLKPESVCRGCGAPNPPGQRFCDSCGRPLRPARSSREPRAYTPSHLAAMGATGRVEQVARELT